MIPDEAVEAAARAMSPRAWGPQVWIFARHGETPTAARDRVQRESLQNVRAALEAAAPHMLAEAWDSAYRLGVDDERTSQANPGIAGCFCNSRPCQCIIEPARENPYRSNK